MRDCTSRKLFVNLPVGDLSRSVAFFTRLGFRFDARFTDESATCMVLGTGAFAMLLEVPRFLGLTDRLPCDTRSHSEAILAVSCESREEVEDLVKTAIASGGAHAREPEDHGFMFGWSFYDPDGHHWEAFWMDPEALDCMERPGSEEL